MRREKAGPSTARPDALEERVRRKGSRAAPVPSRLRASGMTVFWLWFHWCQDAVIEVRSLTSRTLVGMTVGILLGFGDGLTPEGMRYMVGLPAGSRRYRVTGLSG